MFGLNPIPFYIIIGLICTNLFAGGMWWLNSVESEAYQTKLETCQGKHLAFVNKTKAEGEIAAEKAKSIEETSRRTANETAKGVSSARAVVRAKFKRVRSASGKSAGGSGLSAPPASAGGVDGNAEGDLPPTERIIADCAQDVLTLVWLQHHERQQQEIQNERSP